MFQTVLKAFGFGTGSNPANDPGFEQLKLTLNRTDQLLASGEMRLHRAPPISEHRYAAVKIGMTEAMVDEIFQGPGIETHVYKFCDGDVDLRKQYAGKGRSYAQITFRNGKVKDKSRSSDSFD